MLFILIAFAITVIIVVCVVAECQRQAEAERRIRAIQLSDVDNMGGIDFEHYVCRLLRHQGYSAEVTQASNDFGVDVIAQLSGKKFAVQIKRYSKNVSRTAISDAVAGKSHYKCNSAMVVTNCYFTKSAKEFTHSTGCVLVDRDILSEWILNYQGTVTPGSDECPSSHTSHFGSVDIAILPQEPANLCHDPSQQDKEYQEPVSTDSGVPSQILEEIRRRASQDNPGDYSTQQYVVDGQMSACRYMLVVKDAEVKQIAVMEYPNDYEMQKHTYDNQFAAKRYMSAMKDCEVIRISVMEYPNDYEMQKHTYDNQVAAKRYMSTVEDVDVRKIAVIQYPNDYEMQKYTYDKQLSAKWYMSTVKDHDAKQSALLEYPNDYEMQKYTCDNELMAKT